MPDPTPTPPNPNPDPTPTPEPDPAAAETAFWDKFEKKIDEKLEAFYAKKLKDFRPNTSSRGNGRNNLPGIIADIMFGPAKKD